MCSRPLLNHCPTNLPSLYTLITMPVTTIKRCQFNPNWWYTVEDCNVEVDDQPGITVRFHALPLPAGEGAQ